MKPATRDWLKKSSGDQQTALREPRARRRPNYDAVCFHAQQSVEKYLKAILTERGRSFPNIHDLVKLGERCFEFVPHLRLSEDALDLLSRYAVVFRYPGESATKKDAQAVVRAMQQLRELLGPILG